MTLVVPFDPRRVGSANHKWLDRDFLGAAVPQDNRAMPGPFQNLKKGTNIVRVWDGLPLLENGQLPIVFRRHNRDSMDHAVR